MDPFSQIDNRVQHIIKNENDMNISIDSSEAFVKLNVPFNKIYVDT